jgi:four helix bundle protein
VQDFRKLDVWTRAHQLTLTVYKATKTFPKEEVFGLTSQTRRCCVSIEGNIAEGCGRGGKQEFARFLQMALGSASELECHLLIARDLNLLEGKTHLALQSEAEGIKKMLSGLSAKVRP